MTTYITKDGDTLDYIVWKKYETTTGMLEKVIDANRHLATYDAILPAGITITLPDATTSTSTEKIKLWQ